VGVTSAGDLREVVEQFSLAGNVLGIARLPGGHINDSYRVDAGASYLLQRLNPTFSDAGR
jgi:hypothetical protein